MNLGDPPRVLLTGATGGLGAATAVELGTRGWHVLVGGRSPASVDAVVRRVVDSGSRAEPFLADLARLADVRRAAAVVRAGGGRLDAVVANAGVTLRGTHASHDGYERTFAVNVLAHHLLLALLADRLSRGGRVVVLSSGTHLPGHPIARLFRVPPPRWVGAEALARPDHPEHLEEGPVRYSTSKLGGVLLARALQRRLRVLDAEVDVLALDPGLMLDTDLAREAPAPVRAALRRVGPLAARWADGVRTSTTSAGHLADLVTSLTWSGRGFAYVDGQQVRPPSRDAQRDDLADGLWQDACRLVGLREDETVLPLR